MIIPLNSLKFIEKSLSLSKLCINFLKLFSEKEILLSLRIYLKSDNVKNFLLFLSNALNRFWGEKFVIEFNFKRIFSIELSKIFILEKKSTIIFGKLELDFIYDFACLIFGFERLYGLFFDFIIFSTFDLVII